MAESASRRLGEIIGADLPLNYKESLSKMAVESTLLGRWSAAAHSQSLAEPISLPFDI